VKTYLYAVRTSKSIHTYESMLKENVHVYIRKHHLYLYGIRTNPKHSCTIVLLSLVVLFVAISLVVYVHSK
jgi:hypothetical protein